MPLLVLFGLAHAVEGMWEPHQLPSLGEGLAAAGFTGDAAALARLDGAPLGAVVSLGGCTASFVSDEGLLVTNHHCAVGWLQQANREGEDLVDAGFHAPTRADERWVGPTGRVWITTGIRDVTAEIAGKIPKRTKDAERAKLLEARTKATVAACEATPGRRCNVASFYGGAEYRLIEQTELRDLRLVQAPPDSVGNYGDEIDNWHWPRHAGDFAFLRVYVGPDGKPADHAEGNVPYKPAHALKLAARGPKPGEFVMVAGYPGGTDRWRTAEEIARTERLDLPEEIATIERVLAIYAEETAKDPAAGPILEPSRLGLGNGLFLDKGALDGYRRAGIAALARRRDDALAAWIAADPARAARWGDVLDGLRSLTTRRDATRDRDRVFHWMRAGSILLGAAETAYEVAIQREKPDAAREIGYQDRDLDRIRARAGAMQARLHLPTERRLLAETLVAALALPADQRPPGLVAWVGASPGQDPAAAVNAALDRAFAATKLADKDVRVGLLDTKAKDLAASADPFVALAVALHPLREAQRAAAKEDGGADSRLRPRYAEALRAFDPARAYPDANGTLRVTYGTVQGYSPRDGVLHTPQTTLEGIVAKAGPWPFDAPKTLLDAIAGGKRGPYVDPALGTVPVDFLSDLDITGGNSGSPTLNAQGELVGLAFDGNVEGVASDWFFDAPVARSIHVDVRYLLYYLDAVVGADALLRELGVEPAL